VNTPALYKTLGHNLTDKRAVVCGASKGIGRSCAIQLASQGVSITLLARNKSALKAVRDELPAQGDQSHTVLVADFANEHTVSDAVAQYVQSAGGADILINNTGGPPGGLAIDASPDEYLRAFRMHLVCNQILAQALTPGMKERKWGRIVNIISTSVKAPIPGLGVSNTVRGAVASWSKTIAAELAPFGVTVNNILPGFTATGRLESIISTRAAKAGSTEQEIADAMRKTVPMGRFAEPTEIAAAVGFLCSPAAAYITGVSVPVDGGRTNCL